MSSQAIHSTRDDLFAESQSLKQLVSSTPAVIQVPSLSPAAQGALRMIALGVPVAPIVAPGQKYPSLTGFEELATTDEAQVRKWIRQFPVHNWLALARPDGVCFIDEDRSEKLHNLYFEKYGESYPRTRTTQSQTDHLQSCWLQTDRTRTLANQAQRSFRDGILSFRQSNQYCLVEGSHLNPSLQNGLDHRDYICVDNSPIVPMPNKLVDLIQSLIDPKDYSKHKTGKSDSGFKKLFDQVGWGPLIRRMNRDEDSRFHNASLGAKAENTYCAIPSHGPRNSKVPYSACFGVVPRYPEILHCFGCDWSGDLVKACYEVDGGKAKYETMYDCARAICKEEGLKFEDFFPVKSTAQTVYGVPAAEVPPEFQPTQSARKELKFQSSPVEKLTARAYVLGPNVGEKFGLFRLGQVSLISGSSGGGKTSLINQMLVTQALGADFFGYKTQSYRFVLLSRDRNQDAHEETMERMHLALKTIPFVRLPKNVWDIDAAQAIVKEIEKMDPLPKIAFVEGIDMLLGEMNIKCTTYFTGLLEDIAQHFQIALICSIGSPKTKKDQGYPAGRDNILGSSGWGRTIDTLWWMQFTKAGDTSPQRHLIVYPRQTGAKKFTLEFVDGCLEIRPDIPEDTGGGENRRTALETNWYKQQERLAKTDSAKRWWTIVDMENALTLSHATADRHAKNAYLKKWLVKKPGGKQGKGAPAQYRWNDSSANPLWIEEQAAIEPEMTF